MLPLKDFNLNFKYIKHKYATLTDAFKFNTITLCLKNITVKRIQCSHYLNAISVLMWNAKRY